MKFCGNSRRNKPQSGLFSRHYLHDVKSPRLRFFLSAAWALIMLLNVEKVITAARKAEATRCQVLPLDIAFSFLKLCQVILTIQPRSYICTYNRGAIQLARLAMVLLYYDSHTQSITNFQFVTKTNSCFLCLQTFSAFWFHKMKLEQKNQNF